MENESTNPDALIAAVGGLRLPTENMEGYWFRVAKKARVGVRSIRAFWHGERSSQKTVERLKEAAKNETHTDGVVAFTEYYLKAWRINPNRHRHRIDLACEFIDRLRAFDAEDGNVDLSARRQDGWEE